MLWEAAWLAVLELLKLRLLWHQLSLWDERLLRHRSELSSVLRTDWLASVLLPDGVSASDWLLRLRGVSRCRVLWC